jgi:hypothetical protein
MGVSVGPFDLTAIDPSVVQGADCFLTFYIMGIYHAPNR